VAAFLLLGGGKEVVSNAIAAKIAGRCFFGEMNTRKQQTDLPGLKNG